MALSIIDNTIIRIPNTNRWAARPTSEVEVEMDQTLMSGISPEAFAESEGLTIIDIGGEIFSLCESLCEEEGEPLFDFSREAEMGGDQ